MRVLFVGTPEEYDRSIREREDGEPFSLSFFSPGAFAEGRAGAFLYDGVIMPALRFLSMATEPRAGTCPAVTIASGPASVAAECFEAGCSDYLCEPWSEAELLARIEAGASRRRWPLGGGVSLEGRRLVGPDRSRTLGAGDGRMLALLLQNRGMALGRSRLAAVAGIDSVKGRALDMRVSRLRSALRSVGANDAASRIRADKRGYSMS